MTTTSQINNRTYITTYNPKPVIVPSAMNVNRDNEERILSQEEIDARIRSNASNLNDPFNKLN